MPFTSYKTIGDVLKEYQITSVQNSFIVELPININPLFREDLDLKIKDLSCHEGESVACEVIIFPLLWEVYKNYRTKLTLWSHKSISYDAKLSGTPDYIIAENSLLGKEVFDKPFWVTVEAKKDDFVTGWGQCLAEMLAVQKINAFSEDVPTFGIVTNGLVWQFGKLVKDSFQKETKSYLLDDLEKLMGAINYVFHQCELQIDRTYQDKGIKNT